MTTGKVVYMVAVRELLAELDKLRADVLAGDVRGWGGSVTFSNGEEVVYLGGTYKEDSAHRARAMLRVSAVRALHDNYLAPPDRAAG